MEENKEEIVEKKKSNKLVGIILLILGIALIGTGAYFYFGKSKDDGGKKEEVAAKPSLKDDFYESINYDKIQKAVIPKDSSSWSVAYEAAKRMKTHKEELTEQMVSDEKFSNEDMDKIIELYTDYEGRNKRGLDELKPYFDSLDNAKTIEEFNNALVKIQYDLGVNPFGNFSVEVDVNDNTKNILMIEPAKVEEAYYYYTESRYQSFRDKFVKIRTNVLKQYGYDNNRINEVNDLIKQFIEKVQAKSIDLSKITDYSEYFKYYKMEDMKKDLSNLPLLGILKNLKIDNLDKYVIPDYGHFKALNEAFTVENLEALKEITKVSILENLALNFTTDDYFNLGVELMNDLNGTKKTAEDMKNQSMMSLKSLALGSDLHKEYEKKYFTEEDKKMVKDLIDEIKSYYKEIINNCTWMSAETKIEAIKKLDNIKVRVGYQPEEEEEDDVEIVSKSEGGTLISNLITSFRYENDKFQNEVRKDAEEMSYDNFDFNAYYGPTDNSINFPAAFYEIINGETDYYKKLGYFGMVIGHEISHAFDDSGSKYDLNGKLNNWWTDKDREEYKKIGEKIKNYYNKYSVMDCKVDGEMTLGENIADLGGMKAVVYVAEKHGATKDDYKKLFEAYADLWAEKTTKEEIEKQILTDNHSPSKVRVNAVLSSIDKFYEVYDIKEGDKMYVPKEERVGLW